MKVKLTTGGNDPDVGLSQVPFLVYLCLPWKPQCAQTKLQLTENSQKGKEDMVSKTKRLCSSLFMGLYL